MDAVFIDVFQAINLQIAQQLSVKIAGSIKWGRALRLSSKNFAANVLFSIC